MLIHAGVPVGFVNTIVLSVKPSRICLLHILHHITIHRFAVKFFKNEQFFFYQFLFFYKCSLLEPREHSGCIRSESKKSCQAVVFEIDQLVYWKPKSAISCEFNKFIDCMCNICNAFPIRRVRVVFCTDFVCVI